MMLERPQMLILLVPLILITIYFLVKGAKKSILISRMIVIALLIIALASPYTIGSQLSKNDTPDITIIEDETGSMELFEKGIGTELYNTLALKTPTNIIRITGDSTPLGDSISQNARGNNQIIIVSDGNSNRGQDLDEALSFAKETGTSVYSVSPTPIKNDLSLYIDGDKTIVQGNEYEFNIVIKQAINLSSKYKIIMKIDDQVVRDRTFEQNTPILTTPVTHTFSNLGAHTITASLEAGDDSNAANNVFTKTVYVVPKPEIQILTHDTHSPLTNILFNLYKPTVTSQLTNLDNKKAVVIDNMEINDLSQQDIQNLVNYTSSGKGVYIIGGENSYNFGSYLNSPLENLLPVHSQSSEWKGGRNVVLVMDVSSSTLNHGTLPEILANAVSIIRNENLKGSNVGVIAFGTKALDISGGLIYTGLSFNVDRLERDIIGIKPDESSTTSLDQGLQIAQNWLQNSNGEIDVIIISDGGIEQRYKETLDTASSIKELGAKMYYIHVKSPAPSQYDKAGNAYAQELMNTVNGTYFPLNTGERANIIFDKIDLPQENETPLNTTFDLIKYNPNHFITSNINLSGNITGYNDVSPKPGAERLVITSSGKPVLTVWRYGLGRVASLSTDNGNQWSSQLYSNNNSKITSSVLNWLIEDPRMEKGAILEANDTWYGTPAELRLTMYDTGTPSIKLDENKDIDLSLIGQNTYEATVDMGNPGIHSISGYPIAVNYPLEYKDVGINPQFENMIENNGGKVYTLQEAKNSVLQDATITAQNKLNREKVDKKIYFILTALLIFLTEIIIRRLKEIKKMKEQKRIFENM